MIAGPFMPEESYDDLRRQARGLPVRVYRSVTNVPTYLAAADLVVSMAGYNTTVEILRSGRPGLLVPRRGPSAEQRLRADLFAARGWVSWLDPELLDTDAVAGSVTRACPTPPSPAPGPAPDLGQRRAAGASSACSDEQSDCWPVAQGGVTAAAARQARL